MIWLKGRLHLLLILYVLWGKSWMEWNNSPLPPSKQHITYTIYTTHGSRCNLRFYSHILLCVMFNGRSQTNINLREKSTQINCFLWSCWERSGTLSQTRLSLTLSKTLTSLRKCRQWYGWSLRWISRHRRALNSDLAVRSCLFEEKLLISKSTLTPSWTNISILILKSAIRNIQHITRFLLKLMTLKRILTMTKKKKIMVN